MKSASILLLASTAAGQGMGLPKSVYHFYNIETRVRTDLAFRLVELGPTLQ